MAASPTFPKSVVGIDAVILPANTTAWVDVYDNSDREYPVLPACGRHELSHRHGASGDSVWHRWRGGTGELSVHGRHDCR